MERSDNFHLKSDKLPTVFQSPWLRLKKDIIAVIVHISLRIRELWRRNLEGDLSIPRAWPAKLAPVYWPCIFICFLIIFWWISFDLIKPMFDVRLSPNQKEVGHSRESSYYLDGGKTLPNRFSSNENTEKLESIIANENKEFREKYYFSMESILAFISDGKLNNEPGNGIEVVPLMNKVLITVGPDWQSLVPSRQLDLASQLQKKFLEFGYEEIELLDQEDELLVRSPRVGTGMILFNQDKV